jgi:hypothetical protein
MAQLEPHVKSLRSAQRTRNFCARLHIFRGLGSFFCKRNKFILTKYDNNTDRTNPADGERCPYGPTADSRRQLKGSDRLSFSSKPPLARKAACFRSLAKARVSASFAVGSGSRSR